MFNKKRNLYLFFLLCTGFTFTTQVNTVKASTNIQSEVKSELIQNLKSSTYDEVMSLFTQNVRLRFSDIINKRIDICKKKGRPAPNFNVISEDEAKAELKKEYIKGVDYYKASYDNVINDLDNIIPRLIERELKFNQKDEQTIKNQIESNKNKIIFGLMYIDKLYNFNIDNTNIKDIILYDLQSLDSHISPIDFLISLANQSFEDIKLGANVKVFDSKFKNKITNKDNIVEFLRYLYDKYSNNEDINKWFVDNSKAYIVQEDFEDTLNTSYKIFDKLSSQESLYSHILPLLQIEENNIYVISTPLTITYGIFDAYVDKNKKGSDEYNTSILDIKDKITSTAKKQIVFLDFIKNLTKDKNLNLLSKNIIVKDTMALYSDNKYISADQRWSKQYGEDAGSGVVNFFEPLGFYRQPVRGSYGEASGESIYLFASTMLSDIGLSTYAHELIHILDATVLLDNNGRRDDLGAEFYARGLLEPYSEDEAVFSINSIYNPSVNQYTNLEISSINTLDKLKDYMYNMMNVIYTLDYFESKNVLNKDANTKKVYFNKINNVEDTKGNLIEEFVNIDDDTASNLNQLNDLIDNDIVVSRYEFKGISKLGKATRNGYYVVPLFSSNFAVPHSDNATSGDIITRKMAFDLLAEYGYYEGLVPFISNQYKNEANAEQKAFSDNYIINKISGFENAKELKKSLFEKRIENVDKLIPIEINYNNQSITLDNASKIDDLFKEAVDKDIALIKSDVKITKNNSNVEDLKKVIYLAYKDITNDFNESIYKEEEKKDKEDKEDNNQDTTRKENQEQVGGEEVGEPSAESESQTQNGEKEEKQGPTETEEVGEVSKESESQAQNGETDEKKEPSKKQEVGESSTESESQATNSEKEKQEPTETAQKSEIDESQEPKDTEMVSEPIEKQDPAVTEKVVEPNIEIEKKTQESEATKSEDPTVIKEIDQVSTESGSQTQKDKMAESTNSETVKKVVEPSSKNQNPKDEKAKTTDLPSEVSEVEVSEVIEDKKPVDEQKVVKPSTKTDNQKQKDEKLEIKDKVDKVFEEPKETQENTKKEINEKKYSSGGSSGGGGGFSSGKSLKKPSQKNYLTGSNPSTISTNIKIESVVSNNPLLWQKNTNNRWTYHYNQGILRNKWLLNNNLWYYLDNQGNMIYNSWLINDNKWYYSKNDGSLLINDFVKISNTNLLYYAKNDGVISQNEWIYAKDLSGNNKWYYAKQDYTIAQNEWIFLNDKWYYAKSNYEIAINETLKINNKMYKFNLKGELMD